MLVLIGFLYLALPLLSSGATGAVAGYRLAYVGAVRGVLIGVAMGLIAIAANIAYGFLWDAFYEWRCPSVIQLSNTRLMLVHCGNPREREIAFLVGPVIIVGFFAMGSLLVCCWWNRRGLAPAQP